MTRHRRTTRAALGLAILLSAGAASPTAQQQNTRPPEVPARVDVVISRFQGERKTASLPYSLLVSVNSGNMTSIRMGVDVPIGTTTINRDGVTTTEPKYRHIGTSIDCRATSTADGRFAVFVNVQDSSIATGASSDQRTALRLGEPMAFQTLTTSNNLTLRDGQTVQFTMATDKVTGDVVRVDVTLTVTK